ncbi:MAG: PEP/pyruvate-binding domain-containing protein [Rhizomicrobium sp.]|nr:PEP/pyruvate-binding domain-containing protein [Rhizomicrobium sp.]
MNSPALQPFSPAAVLFSTKAATLEFLTPHLTTAVILPLYRFGLAAYLRNPQAVLCDIMSQAWSGQPLIVRSSAWGEDSSESSQAGHFDSVLNVSGPAALRVAIETVTASYGDADPRHEVLVQPMLQDTAASGVVFSVDPNTLSPYAVIAIADGADTTTVTGGRDARTVLISRHAPEIKDERFARLLALITELEAWTGSPALDIEFAFDAYGKLYLFQVRPLVLRNPPTISAAAHQEALAHIALQIAEKSRPHPYLCGRRTMFGVMPDWNPAEMIGIRPRPLALSLYRELITDEIWAYQRSNYGYRNLRSFPLLHDFFGQPFIDIRVSFNSFIPADIPDPLATKLADYYLDCLERRPALHDKVEFEIIFTCYTLDLPDRLRALSAAGFSDDEIATIQDKLRQLTNTIIDSRGLWHQDAAKLETLSKRFEITKSIENPISRIYWLIEDCKRYGTLPFAGLARAGFIAVQMLRTLVSVGALSETDYQAFLGSLEAVSTEMARDRQTLGRTVFLERYGHLRPGTYDIRSPRYDAEADFYFDWQNNDGKSEAAVPFALTMRQMNTINALLKEHGLAHDVVGLFNFLKAAIEGRENAKLIFTRNLSCVLESLAELGQSFGLTREDLSYARIGDILRLHSACGDAETALRRSIAEGREAFALTKAIALPPLITAPDDVWCIETPVMEPNFVTQLAVSAPVTGHENRAALRGAIVAIPSADPGFDWVFSHGIAGLITAYGGVNSHMAIRAGELRIPAVIGAGQVLFDRWSGAQILTIDCANKTVEIVT